MEKCARRSTRRVLLWQGYGSEYLQGTAEELEMVMFDWPGLWTKRVSPFLEIFTKTAL
jgi:hypothetical protein